MVNYETSSQSRYSLGTPLLSSMAFQHLPGPLCRTAPWISSTSDSRLHRPFFGPVVRIGVEIGCPSGRYPTVRNLVAGSPAVPGAGRRKFAFAALTESIAGSRSRRRRSTMSRATLSAGVESIPTSMTKRAEQKLRQAEGTFARSLMPFANPSWSWRRMARHSTRTGWRWITPDSPRAR